MKNGSYSVNSKPYSKGDTRKIKDNEKATKAIDKEIAKVKDKDDAIKKSLESKKAALKEIEDAKKAKPKKKSTKKFSNIAKTKFFHPIPRLKFGIACKNLLSSSIDSSDGLSSCLHELSTSSKKRFIITKFPVKDDVRDFVAMNKLDLKDIILNGGEEFE